MRTKPESSRKIKIHPISSHPTGWVRVKWKDSRGMTWDTLMLASKKDHFVHNIKASGGIVYFAVKK